MRTKRAILFPVILAATAIGGTLTGVAVPAMAATAAHASVQADSPCTFYHWLPCPGTVNHR